MHHISKIRQDSELEEQVKNAYINSLTAFLINGRGEEGERNTAEEALQSLYKNQCISTILKQYEANNGSISGNCFYRNILRISITGEFFWLHWWWKRRNNELYIKNKVELLKAERISSNRSVTSYVYCLYINTCPFESNRLGLYYLKVIDANEAY